MSLDANKIFGEDSGGLVSGARVAGRRALFARGLLLPGRWNCGCLGRRRSSHFKPLLQCLVILRSFPGGTSACERGDQLSESMALQIEFEAHTRA